jgi:hypothetical protein
MQDDRLLKHACIIIHATRNTLPLTFASHHKVRLSTQHSRAPTATHEEGACASGAALHVAVIDYAPVLDGNSENIDGS